MRARRTTLYALLIGASLTIGVQGRQITVGSEEEVLPANAFGLTDFPDGLMGVVRRGSQYYWLMGSFIAGSTTTTHTVRLVSSDLSALAPDPKDANNNARAVLVPGAAATFDDHVAGNGTAYLDPQTGKLYFWYQAMRRLPDAAIQAKEAALGDNLFPAYGRIGLAVSTDLGRTFTKKAAVLEINLTESKFVNDARIGFADTAPPAVVRHGDYLYMYYSDYLDADPTREISITVARLHLSELDREPQPWKKYVNGAFIGEAMGGLFTPVVNRAIFPTVSYNTILQRWIMVYHWENNLFEWRVSPDGIRWSPPEALFRSSDPEAFLLHPTLVGSGEDPGVTGQQFWVYYELAPNRRRYPPGGWLVRRSLSVTLPARLDKVRAYPVPWKPGGGGRFDTPVGSACGQGITFDNAPSEAAIRMYTLQGDLVRELSVTSADGGCKAWDGKNSAGREVASGIYLAVIESAAGDQVVKKVAIER